MLQDSINQLQSVKIETIKNKVVTLFFVAGIDENSVRKKPIKTEEV